MSFDLMWREQITTSAINHRAISPLFFFPTLLKRHMRKLALLYASSNLTISPRGHFLATDRVRTYGSDTVQYRNASKRPSATHIDGVAALRIANLHCQFTST